MSTCPFTPPYPRPLASKAGLLRRFWRGWHSWVHTLFAQSYRMKMGQVRLPRLTLHVVNAPELVEEIMADPGGAFPKHPLLADMLEPLLGASLFTANGPHWAAQRRMMGPAFAQAHLDRSFAPMAAACAGLMADLAHADLAAPLDIDPLMTHVTADVIMRTLFSTPLAEGPARRLHRTFARYQAWAQRAALLGLYGLPGLGCGGRARRAGAEIRALFAPLVAARLQAPPPYPAQDMLDALIAARHPETGAPFSQGDLVDQAAILFLAGHETSATALTWALYLLAESPELQERLHAEVGAVAGSGPIDAAAVKRLEGVRNLFREALRLYPPVSFLPRRAARGALLRGRAVGPEDMLVISPWLIHRHADHWPCPHAFDPDRFARPEGQAAAAHAFLPFGKGPRICIGAGFAMQEAVLILASVIRAYRLRYPAGPKPQLTSRLTLRPRHGMPLWLAPRG